MRRRNKSLEDSMLDAGVITRDQLKEVQAEEKRSGQKFRKVLVRMGLMTEDKLISFLSDKLGVPKIDLGNYLVDPKITRLVPEDLARKHELIPILKIGNRLTCAMVDPWNVIAMDEVRMRTNLVVEPAVASETEVRKALDSQYGARDNIRQVIEAVEAPQSDENQVKTVDLDNAAEAADQPSVIKLVNLTIRNAFEQGASDIHFEPEEGELKIRYRVDGVLHHAPALPKNIQSGVVSRIKVMSSLDITERRKAQDGRFHIRISGHEVDFRVSCIPTIWGENLVLRLLDQAGKRLKLEELGFSNTVRKHHEKLIKSPYGIILVTGPTGSGKTTTLYASLNAINTEDRNIVTIEDPVEYRLPGVRQVQANDKVDLTFANGLRSILRQDPDVIMVGEIRDTDTARIAVNAAQTGHLVLSTLHTNDAAGAITRLIDMGVEPFLMSSSILGVLAQRLVRRICDQCKEKTELPAKEARTRSLTLKSKDQNVAYRGKGCAKCMHTGYRGRLAIFELMLVDEALRKAMVQKASADEMRKIATQGGMHTMLFDGCMKTLDGSTTYEEILRVTQEDE